MKLYDQEAITNYELGGHLGAFNSLGTYQEMSEMYERMVRDFNSLDSQTMRGQTLSADAQAKLDDAERALSSYNNILMAWKNPKLCLSKRGDNYVLLSAYGNVTLVCLSGSPLAFEGWAQEQAERFSRLYADIQWSRKSREDEVRTQAVAAVTKPRLPPTRAQAVSPVSNAEADRIFSLLAIQGRQVVQDEEDGPSTPITKPAYSEPSPAYQALTASLFKSTDTVDNYANTVNQKKAAQDIAKAQNNPLSIHTPATDDVAVAPTSKWLGPILELLKTGANTAQSLALQQEVLKAQKLGKPIYVNRATAIQAQKGGMPSGWVIGGGAAAILLVGVLAWMLTTPATKVTASAEVK